MFQQKLKKKLKIKTSDSLSKKIEKLIKYHFKNILYLFHCIKSFYDKALKRYPKIFGLKIFVIDKYRIPEIIERWLQTQSRQLDVLYLFLFI